MYIIRNPIKIPDDCAIIVEGIKQKEDQVDKLIDEIKQLRVSTN